MFTCYWLSKIWCQELLANPVQWLLCKPFYVSPHCSSLVNTLIPNGLNLDFLLFVKNNLYGNKAHSESRLDFKPGLMFYKPWETLRSLNYSHSWTRNTTHTHGETRLRMLVYLFKSHVMYQLTSLNLFGSFA